MRLPACLPTFENVLPPIGLCEIRIRITQLKVIENSIDDTSSY